jgi:hypothetical protein
LTSRRRRSKASANDTSFGQPGTPPTITDLTEEQVDMALRDLVEMGLLKSAPRDGVEVFWLSEEGSRYRATASPDLGEPIFIHPVNACSITPGKEAAAKKTIEDITSKESLVDGD